MRITYIRAAIAGLITGLFGCAGNPPAPTAQMEVARAAVNDAQSAGATDHAAVELRAAQDKLSRALVASGQNHNLEARQLAEEAEADARLAATKARNAKAQRTVAELRQGVRTLQQELSRQPATTSPAMPNTIPGGSPQ